MIQVLGWRFDDGRIVVDVELLGGRRTTLTARRFAVLCQEAYEWSVLVSAAAELGELIEPLEQDWSSDV